jgi:hypothetical protein
MGLYTQDVYVKNFVDFNNGKTRLRDPPASNGIGYDLPGLNILGHGIADIINR